MLNFVIYYPVSSYDGFNSTTLCGRMPQKFKSDLIEKTNRIQVAGSFTEEGDFLTPKNVFAQVVTVVEEIGNTWSSSMSPVLVTVIVGSEEKHKIDFLGNEFNNAVTESLRSSFGNHEFSVHMIYADKSYIIPYR